MDACFSFAAGLRELMQQLVVDNQLMDKIAVGWNKGEAGPLSPEASLQARELAADWLRAQGFPCTSEIADGQPMALGVLKALLMVS